MTEKLNQLINTLLQVETKGNNTILMADCIRFLYNFVKEVDECESKNVEQTKIISELRNKIVELKNEIIKYEEE